MRYLVWVPVLTGQRCAASACRSAMVWRPGPCLRY